MSSLIVQTPPAVEPISLAQAKRHLNLDHSDDDAYVIELIRTARRTLELRYDRALMTQTLVMGLDGFWQPGAGNIWNPATGTWLGVWGSLGAWSSYRYNAWSILELTPPVQSITSVTYLDPAGNSQTFTNYLADTNNEPGRLYPALNKIWPVTAALPNTVQITFVAGATLPELLSDDIKRAVYLLVAHYYENRSQVEVSIGHLAKAIDLPRGVDELMSNYWRPRVR